MERLFSPVGAASSRDCFEYKAGFPIGVGNDRKKKRDCRVASGYA
jgi:hypothetical protein